MNELHISPERHNRNLVTGRFLKGCTPHNKGKKWDDYNVPLHKRERIFKGLASGRTGNPNIAGCRAKEVVAIRNGQLQCVFQSSNDAERKTGICARNIRHCCSGKRKHAGGYQWFWENDNSWCELVNKMHE
jgi:hypothetical protein|uniref:PROTEIN/DNA Complex catalytic motif, Helix-turn-helix DNA n=1 Tax=Myoviridae sp. ct9Ns12 TaxID=2826626 RepID=A0A8S5MH85_9CAUD|nr:MAG TPA: PROTEIN/DNA Complex catalytic motif, Helix-turn-helix DNA [Myoviridae sp. ct9Ns12]